MKSNRISQLAGRPGMVGLALLALSFATGSAVRAADPEAAPSILENVLDPVANIVMGIEQRLAGLQATVTAFAGSFASERIVAQQLCVADGSGAQTCITKAQLDALLKGALQVSAHAAADQPIAPAGETAAPLPEVAAVAPPVTEQPAAPAGESAASPPEVAAVAPPVTEQPAASASEAAAPLSEVAAAAPPAVEPVETVVAESAKPETAKPETVIAVERAKDEEPAQTGSVAGNAPATELNALPVEEAPAVDRVE